MPTFEDWLNNPVSIIDNIFSSNTHDFDSKVKEYFLNKLKSEKNYNSIPSLNEVPVHQIKPNSLVRYRCMIQDIFNPVYFTNVQRIRHKVSGEKVYLSLKYRESIDIPDGYEIDGDILKEHLDELKIGASEKPDDEEQVYRTNLEQRVTLYCVPIPGENDWTRNSFKVMADESINSINSRSSSMNCLNRISKRAIDGENDDTESNECEGKENQMESASNYGPMICQEKDTDTTTTISNICYKYKTHPKPDEEVVKTVNVTKKTRVEDEKTTTSSDQAGKKWSNRDLNFPLGESEQGHPCLVKICDNFDEFKLNDMVEFVGILTQDPSLAYEYDEHTCYIENDNRQDWQSLDEEEQRKEEKKIETFKLVKEENGSDNQSELIDVSVTRQVTHSHTHKKVVLSAYPPSLVPRLHCVVSHKLTHDNPLLGCVWTQKYDTEGKNAYWKNQLDEFVSSLKSSSDICMGAVNDPLNILRKNIIDTLQEILLGDALAAEYLLMHLLSSVFNRKDITVLGKFALNITNIPTDKNGEKPESNFAECFFEMLKLFVPTAHLFSLTTDNLNKANLIPNKDYHKDKLVSGMLQLPKGFQLCIDETVLNTGELNQKGIINVNSIGDIIKWQKLNYDFCFHQQEFNTDIRVLVLSNTKSILPFDLQVKLDADVDKFDLNEYQRLKSKISEHTSLLNNIRRYLTIISNLDYSMDEHMKKIVESDIVAMRKDETKNQVKGKLSIDDFHLLLVIARLQTMSYGKTELGLNEWNRAKSLLFEKMKRQ